MGNGRIHSRVGSECGRYESAGVRIFYGKGIGGWGSGCVRHSGADEEESTGDADNSALRSGRRRKVPGDVVRGDHHVGSADYAGAAADTAARMGEGYTRFGEVRMKVARVNGTVRQASPEFEDCRKLAEEEKVPLQEVLDAA